MKNIINLIFKYAIFYIVFNFHFYCFKLFGER